MTDADKPCDGIPSARRARKGPSGPPSSLESLVVTGQLGAAKAVREAWAGRGGGSLFGRTEEMPEEALSHGIADELDRLLYLTLAVAIDYQRDAAALWRHARERYEDPQTRWLFQPAEVAKRTPGEVLAALRRGNPKGALRYPATDAKWWQKNCVTLATEYQGDPRVLFERAGWDVTVIHHEVSRPGRFQGLKGAKIFPLWLRMLAKIQGYRFKRFEELPIPVDVHIARATFTTGLVRGRYTGPFDSNLIDFIRKVWTDSCREAGEALMTFDAPLWQLSRLGCTDRNEGGKGDCPKRAACPIGGGCPRGAIELSMAGVRIDT